MGWWDVAGVLVAALAGTMYRDVYTQDFVFGDMLRKFHFRRTGRPEPQSRAVYVLVSLVGSLVLAPLMLGALRHEAASAYGLWAVAGAFTLVWLALELPSAVFANREWTVVAIDALGVFTWLALLGYITRVIAGVGAQSVV